MQERLTSRVTVIDRGGEIEVHITTPKMWWPLVFLPFWLAGWTVGGIAAAVTLALGKADEAAGFLVVWLVFWFFFWLIAASGWLWMAFGQEIVRVAAGLLSIRYDILGRGVDRTFDVGAISGLRATGLFGDTFNPMSFTGSLIWWGIGGGVITFEHGAETRRFGGRLTENEAKLVVERLAKYLPEEAVAR